MPQLIVNPQGSGRSHVGNQSDDEIRRKIVAHLNAAGVPTAGARDDQLLAAYNAIINEQAHLTTNAPPEAQALLELATEVANLVRSSSTHDLAEKLGLKLLENLKSLLARPKATAAGNVDRFGSYSLNGLMDEVLAGKRGADGARRNGDFANYDPNEFLGGTSS